MCKDKLKKEYKKLHLKIERIFNKYDSMNIESDYSDEYNYEISKILPKLSSVKSADAIYDLIVEEFSKSFDIDKSEFKSDETVKNISKEIWKVWQEFLLNKEVSFIEIPEDIKDEWNEYQNLRNSGLKKKANKSLRLVIKKINEEINPDIENFLFSLCEFELHDIQYPLFVECILPLLLKGLKNKSAKEIVYLVKSTRSGFGKEVYNALEDKNSWNEELLEIALTSEPNNIEAINQLVYEYVNFLDFGAHHLPDGVVVELSEANKKISICKEFIEKNKNYINERLLVEFDYYIKLYKDYQNWSNSNSGLSFQQWCDLKNRNYTWCNTTYIYEKN